ncbi:MAG: SIMPL domain-containing protein [Syntrophomonadaceae bacterium]|nr:SIMPL domain-containing protein [Syntrophomonadaceae bacterium]
MNENHARTGWVWVTVALVLALGLIGAAWIVTGGIVKIKAAANTITVTGSAKQEIKSDLIVWNGTFTATSPQLSDAYALLKSSHDKVRAYLVSQGIAEKDLIFSSISTMINRVILPNGTYTNQIESYTLTQQVEIRSREVDKITELSRSATELINQGVEFQSNPPQYFYTKIADLKVKMLSLATKDAFARAEQIATNAGSRVGALRFAKMGVFQITPLYSNIIADYGVNDTSSLEKEITSVVTCSFEIRE